MAKNFGKNLAKSFGIDLPLMIIKESAPFLYEAIKQDIEDIPAIKEELAYSKSKGKEYSGKLLAGFKTALSKETLRNAKRDLLAGNIFGVPERGEKAIAKATMGDFGDDMDMDSSFDEMNEAFEGFESGGKSSDQSSSYSDSFSESGNELNSEFNVNKTQNMYDNKKITTNITQSVDSSLMRSVANSLSQSSAATIDSIERINSFNTEATTEFYNKTYEFYETTTTALNSIVETLNSVYKHEVANTSQNLLSDMFGNNGFLDIKAYIKAVNPIRRLGEFFEDEEWGMYKGYFDSFREDPLGTVSNWIITALTPDRIKDEFGKIEENFNKLTKHMVLELAEGRAGQGGFIKQALGQLFGLDLSEVGAKKAKANLSNYEKGPIAFDGVTKKAIVETIPFYLAKILANTTGMVRYMQMKSHLDLVTDDDILHMDYEKGQFFSKKRLTEIKKAEARDMTQSAFRDVIRASSSQTDKENFFNSLSDKDKDEYMGYLMEQANLENALKKSRKDLEGVRGYNLASKRTIKQSIINQEKQLEEAKKRTEEFFKEKNKEAEDKEALIFQLITESTDYGEILPKDIGGLSYSERLLSRYAHRLRKEGITSLEEVDNLILRITSSPAKLKGLQVGIIDYQRRLAEENRKKSENNINALELENKDTYYSRAAINKKEREDREKALSEATLFKDDVFADPTDKRTVGTIINKDGRKVKFAYTGNGIESADKYYARKSKSAFADSRIRIKELDEYDNDEFFKNELDKNKREREKNLQSYEDILGKDPKLYDYITAPFRWVASRIDFYFQNMMDYVHKGLHAINRSLSNLFFGPMNKGIKGFWNNAKEWFYSKSNPLYDLIPKDWREDYEQERQDLLRDSLDIEEEQLNKLSEHSTLLKNMSQKTGQSAEDLARFVNAALSPNTVYFDSPTINVLLRQLLSKLGIKTPADPHAPSNRKALTKQADSIYKQAEKENKSLAENLKSDAEIVSENEKAKNRELATRAINNLKLPKTYKDYTVWQKFKQKLIGKEDTYTKNVYDAENNEWVDRDFQLTGEDSLFNIIHHKLAYNTKSVRDDVKESVKKRTQSVSNFIKNLLIGSANDLGLTEHEKKDLSLLTILGKRLDYSVINPAKDFLFGKADSSGKRPADRWFDKNSSQLINMGFGGVVGGVGGSLLLSMNPLFAATLGVIAGTNKFQDEFFGDKPDSVKNILKRHLIGDGKSQLAGYYDENGKLNFDKISFIEVLYKRVDKSIIQPITKGISQFLFGKKNEKGEYIRLGLIGTTRVMLGNWLQENSIKQKLDHFVGAVLDYTKFQVNRLFIHITNAITKGISTFITYLGSLASLFFQKLFKWRIGLGIGGKIKKRVRAGVGFLGRNIAKGVSFLDTLGTKMDEKLINMRYRNEDGSIDYNRMIANGDKRLAYNTIDRNTSLKLDKDLNAYTLKDGVRKNADVDYTHYPHESDAEYKARIAQQEKDVKEAYANIRENDVLGQLQKKIGYTNNIKDDEKIYEELKKYNYEKARKGILENTKLTDEERNKLLDKEYEKKNAMDLLSGYAGHAEFNRLRETYDKAVLDPRSTQEELNQLKTEMDLAKERAEHPERFIYGTNEYTEEYSKFKDTEEAKLIDANSKWVGTTIVSAIDKMNDAVVDQLSNISIQLSTIIKGKGVIKTAESKTIENNKKVKGVDYTHYPHESDAEYKERIKEEEELILNKNKIQEDVKNKITTTPFIPDSEAKPVDQKGTAAEQLAAKKAQDEKNLFISIFEDIKTAGEKTANAVKDIPVFGNFLSKAIMFVPIVAGILAKGFNFGSGIFSVLRGLIGGKSLRDVGKELAGKGNVVGNILDTIFSYKDKIVETAKKTKSFGSDIFNLIKGKLQGKDLKDIKGTLQDGGITKDIITGYEEAKAIKDNLSGKKDAAIKAYKMYKGFFKPDKDEAGILAAETGLDFDFDYLSKTRLKDKMGLLKSIKAANGGKIPDSVKQMLKLRKKQREIQRNQKRLNKIFEISDSYKGTLLDKAAQGELNLSLANETGLDLDYLNKTQLRDKMGLLKGIRQTGGGKLSPRAIQAIRLRNKGKRIFGKGKLAALGYAASLKDLVAENEEDTGLSFMDQLNNADSAKDAFNVIRKGYGRVVGKGIRTAAKPTMALLKGYGKIGGKFAPAAVSKIGSVASNIMPTAQNYITQTLGKGSVKLGLGKLAGGIGGIYSAYQDFKETGSILGAISGKTADTITGLLKNAGLNAMKGAAIGSIIPGLGTLFGGAAGFVLGLFGHDPEKAGKLLSGAFDNLGNTISSFIDKAQDAVIDFFPNLLESIINTLLWPVNAIIDKLDGKEVTAPNGIDLGPIGSLFSAIGKVIKSIAMIPVKIVWGIVKGMKKLIIDLPVKVVKALVMPFLKLADKIFGRIPLLGKGIKMIIDTVEFLANFIMHPIDTIKGLFSSKDDKNKEGLIAEASEKNTETVKGYANGGLVTEPSVVVAGEKEPEVIAGKETIIDSTRAALSSFFSDENIAKGKAIARYTAQKAPSMITDFISNMVNGGSDSKPQVGEEKNGLIYNGSKWIGRNALHYGQAIGNMVWDGSKLIAKEAFDKAKEAGEKAKALESWMQEGLFGTTFEKTKNIIAYLKENGSVLFGKLLDILGSLFGKAKEKVGGAIETGKQAISNIGNSIMGGVNRARGGFISLDQLKGGSVPDRIYSFLRTKGMSHNQAVAIMGNIQQESNFNTKAISFDGEGSIGLMQWTGGRRKALQQFASKMGKKEDDLDAQLNFMWHELVDDSSGYEAQQFKKFTALGKDADITTLSNAFSKHVERPNAAYAHNEKRAAYATAFGQKYAGAAGDNLKANPSLLGGIFGGNIGVPSNEIQAKLVQAAQSYLGRGIRYSQGEGRLNPDTSGVTDCSGLTAAIYKKAFGKDILTPYGGEWNDPGRAGQWNESIPIDTSQAQPGDLVFWNTVNNEPDSHVGMVLDPSKHLAIASNCSTGPTTFQWDNSYWAPKFSGIRRPKILAEMGIGDTNNGTSASGGGGGSFGMPDASSGGFGASINYNNSGLDSMRNSNIAASAIGNSNDAVLSRLDTMIQILNNIEGNTSGTVKESGTNGKTGEAVLTFEQVVNRLSEKLDKLTTSLDGNSDEAKVKTLEQKKKTFNPDRQDPIRGQDIFAGSSILFKKETFKIAQGV